MLLSTGVCFSFKQPFFVLRFVFGLTHYQIGIFPMSDFIAEYSAEGRWVRQQRLQLSRQEKLKILRAIEENAKPENRTYTDTISSMTTVPPVPRDDTHQHRLQQHQLQRQHVRTSYREEIHKLNEQDHWARFGNDLLLGVYADSRFERRNWEFLPDNLSKDSGNGGKKRLSSTNLL